MFGPIFVFCINSQVS